MAIRKFLAGVGTLITLFGAANAIADINLGVFPRRSVAVTHTAFKPLAEKLSAELGEPVNLIVPKDFAAFWKGVEQQQYDLVHLNQYHYLLGHKQFGYQVIAINEEGGKTDIAGALTVRNDSGIENVADLKGKSILFGGGKKAMGSYIAVIKILHDAGLTPDDYKAQFAKNPPSAVIGVFNKAADAAGSGDVVPKLDAVTKKIDASQMKSLAVGERFIQLPWAVKGDMAADKVTQIQAIMTSLKSQAPEVLKAAKVSNFVAATDADFGKVREIVKSVTGENL